MSAGNIDSAGTLLAALASVCKHPSWRGGGGGMAGGTTPALHTSLSTATQQLWEHYVGYESKNGVIILTHYATRVHQHTN